jgi:diguanylate cyclase (GGDEF)-like protein
VDLHQVPRGRAADRGLALAPDIEVAATSTEPSDVEDPDRRRAGQPLSGPQPARQDEQTGVPDDMPVDAAGLQWLAIGEGLLAAGALVTLTFLTPVRPGIALVAPGIAPGIAPLAGVAFWLLFGLLGGLRAGPRPGGSVLTFSMPFNVAGTVLGGPVVGAWMGLISEYEPRELRVPWYGIVTNHANVIISASIAGLIGAAYDDTYRLVVGPSELFTLSTVLVTALIFTAINTALVVPVLMFRTGATLREAATSYEITLRRSTLAEAILAWLMVVTYLLVGWWAPIGCVALVIVIWRGQAHEQALIHDEMTGLLNARGFRPIAQAALRAARAGRAPSALLVFDLDGFGAINKELGLEVGDDVLVHTARRIQTAVRATDSVARWNRAGDEFAVLFSGVGDATRARNLAARLLERISVPLRLRGQDRTVTVGASMGICLLAEQPDFEAAFDLADRRSQLAKNRGKALRPRESGGIWPDI